jgi:formylglycine-generating enzyme required for sulfatase activity
VESSPHFLRTLELPRGRLASLGVRGEGLHPVHFPLPVRPGRHSVRVPIYGAGEIPERAVLVPAGTVPACNRHGSFSEVIDPADVRHVDHDFAISNLVTQGEWLVFLAALADGTAGGQRVGSGASAGPSGSDGGDGLDAALARAPAGWRASRGGFRDAEGGEIELAQPVRFVGYDDVLAYLAFLSNGTNGTNGTNGAQLAGARGFDVRLPTLNEIKRAGRGNDARVFPWGDATARRPSVAAFQFIGHPPASAPMPSVPDDPRFGDRSPFSSPEGPAVYHLVGNVTELVSIGVSAEDRAPIVAAFPAIRGNDPADESLSRRFFVTFGLPYDRPAPTNGDVIGVERWPEVEGGGRQPRLPYGFRWALPLRTAASG